MKVCIFTADSNGGYPVPAVKDGAVPILIEHLVEQNSINKECDLKVVSFYDKDAQTKAEQYNNVEFIWIKVPKILKFFDFLLFKFIKIFFKKKKASSYKTIFSLLYYISKSSKILKKETFDKVVLENNIPLALIIKKSKYKGEYYYHLHNIPRVNMNCKSVFENCNGYLCVSDFVGNEILSSSNPIGPIDKNKIHTLYNCIDTSKFCVRNDEKFCQDLRYKYNIKDDEKILLFVGRLSYEKGIDKILEALNLISNEKFKLLIVGGLMHSSNIKDEYHNKLNDLIKDKLKDKVVFVGYVQQENIPKYYNAADIAIMPSMWEEPAGLTMIEALCCGANLITTNSGGIPEYVSEYAIVLEKDDNLVKNLSVNVKKLLDKERNNDNSILTSMYKKYSLDGYMKRFIKELNFENNKKN